MLRPRLESGAIMALGALIFPFKVEHVGEPVVSRRALGEDRECREILLLGRLELALTGERVGEPSANVGVVGPKLDQLPVDGLGHLIIPRSVTEDGAFEPRRRRNGLLAQGIMDRVTDGPRLGS